MAAPWNLYSSAENIRQKVSAKNILQNILQTFSLSGGEHLCESRWRRGSIPSPADNRNVRRCNSKLIISFLPIFWLLILSAFVKKRHRNYFICLNKLLLHKCPPPEKRKCTHRIFYRILSHWNFRPSGFGGQLVICAFFYDFFPI